MSNGVPTVVGGGAKSNNNEDDLLSSLKKKKGRNKDNAKVLGFFLPGKVICLPDPKIQEYPVLPGKK